MNDLPATLGERMPRKAEENAVQETNPAGRATAFLGFRYSHTEISAVGGAAHVKFRDVRFQDGKLTDEFFEGEIERSVYEHTVAEAQRFFLGEAELLMKSFASMLSFWQPGRTKRS